MELKRAVQDRFLQLLNDRIDVLEDLIADLSAGAQNDAKGSAGDKHETTLSRMHLEQEKLAEKLRVCINQRVVLQKSFLMSASDRVVLGSLVKSNGFYFYISVALPKVTLGIYTIFALSTEAPLGAAMLGKSNGDAVTVVGTTYVIEEIM